MPQVLSGLKYVLTNVNLWRELLREFRHQSWRGCYCLEGRHLEGALWRLSVSLFCMLSGGVPLSGSNPVALDGWLCKTA